jgi:SAM-dependent methyltransferase
VNTEKWDKLAEAFAAGTAVPANGWEAWGEQAAREAATIRNVLPRDAETIVEVGCGVGRLTPYLAMLFPRVIATDTSSACRVVTKQRCKHRPNVKVRAPGTPKADAAVIWCLYDEDWTALESTNHLREMLAAYSLVLEGNADAHWLYDAVD